MARGFSCTAHEHRMFFITYKKINTDILMIKEEKQMAAFSSIDNTMVAFRNIKGNNAYSHCVFRNKIKKIKILKTQSQNLN